MGTRLVDEIEALGEEIARGLFGSETADLSPLSGHIADLIVTSSFLRQGDTLMCVSSEDGGYPGLWKEGLPKILGFKLEAFPFSKQDMNVDAERAVQHIVEVEPKLVILGASLILFPHPTMEVAEAAGHVGADVGFDGSHVMGLIGGGKFQNPLQEGASMLFGSTHKTFFGPQGGIILADEEHGEVIKNRIHPALVDNAHWNRVAALTLALAEMKEFGGAYATQVIRNSQTLAKFLDDAGLPVLASHLGYTKSHQVLLDYGGYKRGREVAERLERANIIADCGVRLGTCEVTRLGMKEEEMESIGELIRQALLGEPDLLKIKERVEKLTKEFQDIQYCFQ